jgi:hypothetical protein
MDDADIRPDAGDGQWMSYAALADVRQITRRAAVRLAQRHRLRRQPGNDGSVRVWVPADMATSSPFRPFPPADVGPDAKADAGMPPVSSTPFHVAALEDALRAADGRADAALALADRLTAQLADAVAQCSPARRQISVKSARYRCDCALCCRCRDAGHAVFWRRTQPSAATGRCSAREPLQSCAAPPPGSGAIYFSLPVGF